MARDYRHGHARRAGFQRKSQQDGSAQESGVNLSSGQMLWLGGLVVTLLLVAAFFVIKHFASQGVKASEMRTNQVYQTEVSSSEQALAPSLVAEAPAVAQVEPKSEVLPETTADDSLSSRFTFYHDLALTEVVVDVEPLPIELPEPMWIQAGSFNDPEQAAREQARLLRGGHEVLVSPIDTASGRFYRIMAGPYTDRLIMNQVRNSLRRFGADTRVVRIKAETPVTQISGE